MSALPSPSLVFTSRTVHSIEQAPLYAAIDRVFLLYHKARFNYDPQTGLIRVNDDEGRELTYRVVEETANAFMCELVCDYHPDRDEADFVDKDDQCACTEAVCEECGATERDDVLEFLEPGTVTVKLVKFAEVTHDHLVVSDVISLADCGDRLIMGLADGRMVVIAHPFYGYTVEDPGVVGDLDAGEYAEAAPAETASVEPELDREGLERLRNQAAQEKAQRQATQEVLSINPMDVLEGLLGALVVSLATNR